MESLSNARNNALKVQFLSRNRRLLYKPSSVQNFPFVLKDFSRKKKKKRGRGRGGGKFSPLRSTTTASKYDFIHSLTPQLPHPLPPPPPS